MFLVNFFTDSEYNRWTVLEDYTTSDKCLGWRRKQAESARVPFEPGPAPEAKLHPYLTVEPLGKDRALCSELKHLYVGITRCRTHAFLLEEEESARTRPMRRLWARQQVCGPGAEPWLPIRRWIWGVTGRGAGQGCVGGKRRPQGRLGRRLEGVAEAVGGGCCRLQTPVRLALGVRGTVAGHRLGALEGGGGYLSECPFFSRKAPMTCH